MTVERIHSDSCELNQSIVRLLDGKVNAVCIGSSGNSEEKQRTILPGAFDPLHNGHLKMAKIAQHVTGVAVEFELSVLNVEKPALELTAIESRISQFGDQQTVWLTKSATFEAKSDIFRRTTFVVGTDTIVRIADAGYYDRDQEKCKAAINRIIRNDCRFLVFGRTAPKGFTTLRELALPRELCEICTEVSEEEFREDISSSMLRDKDENRHS